MVLETLVYLPLNHLTRFLARESCIEFSSRESFRLCMWILAIYLSEDWLFYFTMQSQVHKLHKVSGRFLKGHKLSQDSPMLRSAGFQTGYLPIGCTSLQSTEFFFNLDIPRQNKHYSATSRSIYFRLSLRLIYDGGIWFLRNVGTYGVISKKVGIADIFFRSSLSFLLSVFSSILGPP